MTNWAQRAKAEINKPRSTDKTDKSLQPRHLTVSSVPPDPVSINQKEVSSVLTVPVHANVEKNDSISAIKEDPDRWCWPNSVAMNGREIDIFLIRLDRFRSLGLDLDSAEKLADRLVNRDRDLDDRKVCFECSHLHVGCRCMNWRNAGIWLQHSNSKLQDEFVYLLQRCPGFKPAIGAVNE